MIITLKDMTPPQDDKVVRGYLRDKDLKFTVNTQQHLVILNGAKRSEESVNACISKQLQILHFVPPAR
jgi:hypothetical protein